jgi:hypothetical protein
MCHSIPALHPGLPTLLGFTPEPFAGIRRGDMPAMVKRVQTVAELLVEPGKRDRTRLVMLFKQPERFPVVVLSSLSQNNGPKLVQEGADAFIEKSSLPREPTPAPGSHYDSST